MTRGQKTEKYLNKLYSSIYSEEEAVYAFIYLSSEQRKVGTRVTEKRIRQYHSDHELGTMLRKFDSIAFQVSMSDHNIK